MTAQKDLPAPGSAKKPYVRPALQVFGSLPQIVTNLMGTMGNDGPGQWHNTA